MKSKLKSKNVQDATMGSRDARMMGNESIVRWMMGGGTTPRANFPAINKQMSRVEKRLKKKGEMFVYGEAKPEKLPNSKDVARKMYNAKGKMQFLEPKSVKKGK